MLMPTDRILFSNRNNQRKQLALVCTEAELNEGNSCDANQPTSSFNINRSEGHTSATFIAIEWA